MSEHHRHIQTYIQCNLQRHLRRIFEDKNRYDDKAKCDEEIQLIYNMR